MKRIMAMTTILCIIALARSAGAAGNPPSHRHLLSQHLTRDMDAMRSRGVPRAFSEEDRRRVRDAEIGDSAAKFRVSEKQIDRLDEYYRLVRKRVREDMHVMQVLAQQGDPTDAQVEAWESDREGLRKMATEFAADGESVNRLANLIYMSVPGYSLQEYNTLPEMYYVFNEETGALDYVGPSSDAALADMATAAITLDSPLYVPWVYLNRGEYHRWATKHHDIYSRFSKNEPRLAAAVRGEMGVKERGGEHAERNQHGSVSVGKITQSRRGPEGPWSSAPKELTRSRPTPTRSPSAVAPRTTVR